MVIKKSNLEAIPMQNQKKVPPRGRNRLQWISNLGIVVLFATLTTSCMNIPSTIVNPDRYLKAMSDHHDAKVIYNQPWTGTFLPWVTAEVDQIQRLMLIDVKDDPIYQAFELQVLMIDGQEFRTAITARNDDTRDYYYEPGFPMTTQRIEGLNALLNNPRFIEHEFESFLEIDYQGLNAGLDLVDWEGRPIHFRIKEHRTNINLSGILAPVSSGSDNPQSFPLVYLDDFSMVQTNRTEIEIRIDNQSRKPVVFPLLVEGQRSYYSRYSSRVAIADLLPTREEGISSIPLPMGQTNLNIDSTQYQISWNQGFPELASAQFISGNSQVRLSFFPPLPNLQDLTPGIPVEGRFLISVNQREGIIAGRYGIEGVQDSHGVHLTIQPEIGWQPPGMGRKPWVSSFSFEAQIVPNNFLEDQSDRTHFLSSRWFRNDR